MAGIPDERLFELYQLAANEKDPKRLMSLVAEIDQALDERKVWKPVPHQQERIEEHRLPRSKTA